MIVDVITGWLFRRTVSGVQLVMSIGCSVEWIESEIDIGVVRCDVVKAGGNVDM